MQTESVGRAKQGIDTAVGAKVEPATNGVNERTPVAGGQGGLRVPETQTTGAGVQGGLWAVGGDSSVRLDRGVPKEFDPLTQEMHGMFSNGRARA